jgi:hypothetical protein
MTSLLLLKNHVERGETVLGHLSRVPFLRASRHKAEPALNLKASKLIEGECGAHWHWHVAALRRLSSKIYHCCRLFPNSVNPHNTTDRTLTHVQQQHES